MFHKIEMIVQIAGFCVMFPKIGWAQSESKLWECKRVFESILHIYFEQP